MGARRALVTGGGRGIGEAIARRLAEEGFRVFVTARTRKDLERIAKETGADYEVCDVTVPSSVNKVIRMAGNVDVLVNNAGTAEGAPLVKMTQERWRRILDTNLTSAFLFCRAVVPGMIERGYGRIVNIASLAARRPVPYISAYAASKAGLLAFSSSLAMELVDRGVMVNTVCPGYVDTELTRSNVTRISRAAGTAEAEVLKKMLASLGQSAMLSPAHVAEVVVALSREDCTHTGAAVDL